MPGERPPKRCIKVAVVVGTLGVGGAELDIVRNVPRLDRSEFEVVVIAFEAAGPLAPVLEQEGIRVIARGVGAPSPTDSWLLWRTRRLVDMASAIPWIGRTLNQESVDIAHFYLPYAYAYGMLACALWRPKTKRVMSRLSLNFYSSGHRILSWLERHVFHRSLDIAIGNSQPILDELVAEGVAADKVRLLHNGIDPEPFVRVSDARQLSRASLGIDADAFVIAAVGNLHAYKGHADLIEACALVNESLPQEWLLFIAGRDEKGNRVRYEQLVAARGLGDHVTFLGEVEDVVPLLLAADVFAHPSHHEGLPNALIEAMAASLTVVATNVGGIPEAVHPAGSADETGWLVPPCSPVPLSEALVAAASDPARRSAMGERARERVIAEFSLSRSAAAYASIYHELMP